MKIYALDSDNEEFQSLINSLAEKISIDLFDDFETLMTELEEDCQGILFDFDKEPRKKNKFITKLKKQFPDIQIFLLANSLDAKKLAKHQKSKTGAHLYFQTPLDDDLLESMLEPFIDLNSNLETIDEEEVLKEHQIQSDISKDATGVSDNLDRAFSAAFFDEYSESEEDVQEVSSPSAGDLSEISLDQSSDNEVSMEEVSMDDAVGLDEVGVDEVSLDNEVEEFSLGADDEDGLSLTDDSVDDISGDSNWAESEELSLGEEASSDEETFFPDEDDLSFPDMDIPAEVAADSSQTDSGESGVGELELKDDGELLELGGDDDPVATPQESNDEFSMDLGGEEFSLGEDELSFGADEAQDISINEQKTPSQVFDLGGDEDTATQIGEDQLNNDDSEISLAAEEDELAAAINSANELSGLDDELQLNAAEDEELTRPTMDIETQGLKEEEEDNQELSADDFSVQVESKFDDSKQDDIGALLNQASEDLADSVVSVEERVIDMPKSEGAQIIEAAKDLTSTGVTIQGISMPNELQQEENPAGTGITMAHPPEEEGIDQAGLDQESGETKTSIALDAGSLTSYDLPESPDFSETVERKLQEIDDMIEDESGLDEDSTVVVDPSQLETNIYATQGISDDTTVVQPNPMEQTKTQIATPVPQDLKAQHRDYVQSHDEELIRLGETIKQLRADREAMSNKIADLEAHQSTENRQVLDLQAQLDEKNIELVVIRKRFEKQIDDLKFQLDIALDKKEILAKQNEKNVQELETLSRQKKLDVNKIRARERELEEKLEMLRTDAEIQIRNRDQKILDLKRRIDTLEFDIESSHMKEKQSKTQQVDLQDKMDRVIKTLRGAIGQLEDDYGADERLANIKKNLDV